MAKRDTEQFKLDGHSIFIKDLEELGFIPEGVVNWIALMGWSYDDRTEFFSMRDLIEKFSLEHLNPAPAAVDFTKFDHFNGMHIRSLSKEDLTMRLAPFILKSGYKLDKEKLLRAIPIIQPRLVTLDDVIPVAGFLFKDEITVNPADLVGDKLTPAESARVAREIYSILQGLPSVGQEAAELPLRNLADSLGFKVGQVFGILRNAVTGQKNTPPLFECMEIIGREKVLQRIKTAAELLEKM